ncbi:general odorant-binding protein 84a isoform X2 [Hermetia illucens]|uniref:general odorant-binding protein 84a isoform X2 n=1 Tax=Hermetia illucens TaxID=343691 RepID=UPI0018CC0A92|nr:general odorant-binding protein 84a isoform X2 [Hermetia illucens]
MLSTVARGLILICAVASAVSAPLSQTENDKSGSENHKRNAEDLASAANDEVNVGMNLQEIMSICNESFRINFEYMEEFNNSGSLPDETDTTPMCFMRCVLEKAQVLNNGIIDKFKVTTLLWPATGDSVEVCQAEGGRRRTTPL